MEGVEMIDSICNIWANISAVIVCGLGEDVSCWGSSIIWDGGGVIVSPGCVAPMSVLLASVLGCLWMNLRGRTSLFYAVPILACAGSVLRIVALVYAFRISPEIFSWLHGVGTWPAFAIGIMLIIFADLILPRKLHWRFFHE